MRRQKSLCLLLVGVLAYGALNVGCSTTLKQRVRDDIVTQMSRQQLPLRRCYRQALQRDRAAAGELVVTFRVDPDSGQSREVTAVSTTLKDAALRRCVEARARRVRLRHRPDRPLDVTYPVRFTPEPQKRSDSRI